MSTGMCEVEEIANATYKNAKTIFEFASNGWQKESIEFGWAKVKNDNCETNMIGFSAGDATTSANSTLFYNGYEITNATHNHPDELFGPSNADIDFAQKVCVKMGRPDANIMFGPNYNKVNLDRCLRTDNHTVEVIGRAPEETYIDCIGGHGDINKPAILE